MFAKLGTSIPAGFAVTFTLLFLMQALISMQPGLEIKTLPRFPIVWRHVDIPEELIIDDFVPPVLPKIEHPPTARPDTDFVDSGTRIQIARTSTVPPASDTLLSNPFTRDGPLMAIVRVRPVYPAGAAQRGLEGFVLVEFDVMANGTVSNVRVIESSSSIFERSAINAAKKFRFKARVLDGEPRTSSGIRYQFRFRMED